MTISATLTNPAGVRVRATRTPYQYQTDGTTVERQMALLSDTPIERLNTVEVRAGKNTLAFGAALVPFATLISENNLFPCTVTITPGTYETSDLLRLIEEQLNSSRVYGDPRIASSYKSGGYKLSPFYFPPNTTAYDFGSVDFVVALNDSGYVQFDCTDNTANPFTGVSLVGPAGSIYTKVFTGIDRYPTENDFIDSLPHLLGFEYKKFEDNSIPGTLYNKYLYTSSYDIPGKTGFLMASQRSLAYGDITRYIQPLDYSVEIVDGKNTLKIAVAIVRPTNISAEGVPTLFTDNVYIQTLEVPPGRYEVPQVLSIIESQMNSPRQYEAQNNTPGYQPDEYVSGGFSFEQFGVGKVSSTLSLNDIGAMKVRLENMLSPTTFNVGGLFFAAFATETEYPDQAAFVGSLADILKVPYLPGVKFVDVQYDPAHYMSSFVTTSYDTTTKSFVYEHDLPILDQKFLRLRFDAVFKDSEGTQITKTVERANIEFKKYTFREIKGMVEDMVNNGFQDFSSVGSRILVRVEYDADTSLLRFVCSLAAPDYVLVNGIQFGMTVDEDGYEESLARCMGMSIETPLREFSFPDAYIIYPMLNFKDGSGIDVTESGMEISSAYGGSARVYLSMDECRIGEMYTNGAINIWANAIQFDHDVNTKVLSADISQYAIRKSVQITDASPRTIPSSRPVLVLIGTFVPYVTVKIENALNTYVATKVTFISEWELECTFPAWMKPGGGYNLILTTLDKRQSVTFYNLKVQ